MTKVKMQHKIGLINLYSDQINQEESQFMVIVLKEAIQKLGNGVDPHKVENWVVKLEKIWRQL
jgi:hypothetical protein